MCRLCDAPRVEHAWPRKRHLAARIGASLCCSVSTFARQVVCNAESVVHGKKHGAEIGL